MRSSQRSGTTLGALPPVMTAAFALGRPTSGCSRSGSTSARRSTNRDIDVMALTPRWGVEPWAPVPFAVATIHAPPRSASPTRRSLGSPTMHASWTSKPRSSRTLVPYRPMCSSSAARWNVNVPARSMPARRIAAAAASADATGPFMSAEPRPISLPSSTTPSHGPCRQFARSPDGHDVEVAVPREGRPVPGADRRDHARPLLLASDRLRGRAEPREDVGRDGGRLVLGTARVLAGRGDQRPRERQDLVRVDRAAAAASAMSSSTMATDGTRDPVANGTARFARAGSIALARARRSSGGRPRPVRRGARAVARVHRALERDVAPRRRDLVPRRVAGSRAKRSVRPRSARRSRRSGWTRRRRS